MGASAHWHGTYGDGTGPVLPAAPGFGQALRTIRGRMSQSRLAALAGFDHSYISRLEAGTRQPTLDTVERISTALGLGQSAADKLRMAANFMPADADCLYPYPQMARLDRALERAPSFLQLWALESLEAIVGHLERAHTS